jgi:hypothetical protein
MAYTNLGGKPVIPAADLLNLQSEANKPGVGAARVGATPHALGKRSWCSRSWLLVHCSQPA